MTIFGASYAALYDTLYDSKDYTQEADLIEAAFAQTARAPASVLDIGCGTGRHLLELAGRGYALGGVDLSEAMLARAQEALSVLPEPDRPQLLCGDARSFDFNRKFDSAIMMFAVIGYLTHNDDVLAALRNIRRHLADGAPFIFDFWYGPGVLRDRPSDRVRAFERAGGRTIRAVSTQLDILHHKADVRVRIWAPTWDEPLAETSEQHHVRFFFPQEIALFLATSGFELLTLSAFPTLDTSLTEDHWNAVAVARAV